MSTSINSINSKIILPHIEAPKANVNDQVKTAQTVQKTSDPATIVTLGESKPETLGLYTNAGVAEKPSSQVISEKATANPASNTSATQFSEQNQKQLKNYSDIQQSSQTAATPQNDRSERTISFLI